MAEAERTTREPQAAAAGPAPGPQPEVRVYEYIIPGAFVRPPRIVYPGMMPLVQPMSPAQRLLARWAQRRYGRR